MDDIVKHDNEGKESERLTPEEREAEMAQAGFRDTVVLALLGPGWFRKDFDRHWGNPQERDNILSLIRAVESERSLMAVSPHVVGVGRKR